MSAPTTKTFGKSTRSVPHPTEKAQKWYPAEDEAKPRKVRWMHSFSGLILGLARVLRTANWVELDRDAGVDGLGPRKHAQRRSCGGTTGNPKAQGIPARKRGMAGQWGNGDAGSTSGRVFNMILTLARSQVRKSIRPWAPRSTLQPGTVLILLAGRFRGKRVVLLKNLDQGVLLVTGPFKINGVPLRRVNSRYVIATSVKVDLAGIDSAKIEEISGPKYFTAEKAKEKAGEDAFFKQGEKAQVRDDLVGNRSGRAAGLTRYTEEGGFQQPGGRPEGYRQGADCQHQEGRPARQLPRHLFQPPQGRQAPPDEVVGGARGVGVMGGRWRGLRLWLGQLHLDV